MSGWLWEWNNLGPMVGILVSFLGFTVAVLQIRRTAKAVDAAKKAVESTRETFIRSQVLATITRLIERTQEMRIFIRTNNGIAHIIGIVTSGSCSLT